MADMKKIIEKLIQISIKTKNDYSLFLFMFLLFIFLSINIFFSQNISSVFFEMSNNEKKSVVQFLQTIRSTSYFSQQLKYFESIYGLGLKNDVYSKEIQRKSKIKQFEQILEKNRLSRDVLYRLYQLYLEDGNNSTAMNYLKLVKEIDPGIKD